ncbi:hypothetical protein LEP1GSC158_3788 [Leptospira interrogans serovar Zanoni str. LT2156]|uniref:Uncharacterized protein n=1 Tax=Leptospira interrogans serovar Zanoni str. LT2156 TaxID=1001601 RepID=M6HNA9_LEPIR|nr:hypothetical protein LEP1GSC158_3788 [Leptospira interrogans serovar Zanoni str. LT2156]
MTFFEADPTSKPLKKFPILFLCAKVIVKRKLIFNSTYSKK